MKIEITNAILHSRPVTVTFSWLLFDIIKIYFPYSCVLCKHPTQPCHSGIPNQHTAHPLHNLSPSLLTLGTAPIPALLSHAQTKLSSHSSPLQSRERPLHFATAVRDEASPDPGEVTVWSCPELLMHAYWLLSLPCGISISLHVCQILSVLLFLCCAV